jgi:hypothetical protein
VLAGGADGMKPIVRALLRANDELNEEEATMSEQPFAPIALDEEGNPVVCCEKCGSVNLELDGWDIDKCRDCGHWRYRDEGDRA